MCTFFYACVYVSIKEADMFCNLDNHRLINIDARVSCWLPMKCADCNSRDCKPTLNLKVEIFNLSLKQAQHRQPIPTNGMLVAYGKKTNKFVTAKLPFKLTLVNFLPNIL